MKYIELTQNKKALVDDADFEWLSQKKWFYNASGYAVRAEHVRLGFKRYTSKSVRMHRLIMNAPKNREVDHINGDRLDNRRSNLRLATHIQNAFNRGKASNNLSGYKGVSKHSSPYNLSKPWRASIVVNRRRVHLGFYETKEKASEVYIQAAQKYHGEFACIS